MTPDDHALLLGKLMGNLQSLESMIRMFLVKTQRESFKGLAPADLVHARLQDEYDESSLTSYDAMKDLIKKFNDEARRLQVETIDAHQIVRLRDLLAHGRILNGDRTVPLRIVKFSKRLPNGRYRMVDNVLMTSEWYGDCINQVWQAIRRVEAAFKAAR